MIEDEISGDIDIYDDQGRKIQGYPKIDDVVSSNKATVDKDHL